MLVGIIQYHCPNLIRLVLLNAQDVVLVVVRHVEVREVELTVFQNHQNLIIIMELSEELSVLIVVQAVDIRIEPDLSAAECRTPMTLQRDAMHGIFRQQVALCVLSFDDQFAEVLVDKQFLLVHAGLEGDFDYLCFSVRVSSEIEHPATLLPLGKVVFTVACHTGHIETLDEIEALTTVAIYYIIYRTTVALLEYS